MTRPLTILTSLLLLLAVLCSLTPTSAQWQSTQIHTGSVSFQSVTNALGLTGNTSLFLNGAGALASPGGGDALWATNTPFTDVEGGTVYGSYALNPLTNGVFAFSVNYLTNFWIDYSSFVSIGYPQMDMNLAAGNASIFNSGDYAGYQMSATNCSGINNYGTYAGFLMAATNCSDIYNYGGSAGAQMSATNCNYIYNYGILAGYQMSATNSSDIYSFGSGANQHARFDGKSHIMVIGSAGTATNSNDFVFGDSAYNYFFPGASMRIEGPVSAGTTISAGGTNRWGLGGVAAPGGTTNITLTINGQNFQLIATPIP